MQTVITERGQISIPSELRRRYHLTPGTEVEWMETPDGIYLLPVPKDPIAAFRGKSRKLSTKLLLDERNKDRRKEK